MSHTLTTMCHHTALNNEQGHVDSNYMYTKTLIIRQGSLTRDVNKPYLPLSCKRCRIHYFYSTIDNPCSIILTGRTSY